MGRHLDKRLTQLEQRTPGDPPTYQVIWPDGPGPVQPAPHGKWAGLLHIEVVYTDNSRGENEAH